MNSVLMKSRAFILPYFRLEAHLLQYGLHLSLVIALEFYASVLGCSACGALVLQLLGQIVDVDGTVIDTIDHRNDLSVPTAIHRNPDGL